jgi:hypothetical protein
MTKFQMHWPADPAAEFKVLKTRRRGAGGGNRTHDRPLTRRVLYQLSYASRDRRQTPDARRQTGEGYPARTRITS